MPDNTQNPGFVIPPPPPNSIFIPDSGMPKMEELDNWQNRQQMKELGPSGKEYAQSIASGESITDLVTDVQALQDRGQAILDNNKNYVSTNPGGFNPDAAFQDLSRKINPETPTLRAAGRTLPIGTEAEFNRYKDSKNFQTFGYTPNMGSGQEYKYGNAMTWGETIGNALAGGSHLAYDTFVEGWKGWGRMAEALFTWDSSKLMGSEEERYEIAKRQEELFNKYAIYDTAESKDGYFNRQFFGNMLQQTGFAVGAIGQFALEEWATAGLGIIFEAGAAGMLVGRVARTAEELRALRIAAKIPEKTTIIGRAAEGVRNAFRPKLVETTADLVNATRKTADVITKSERVTNAIADGLKALTPGYGTVEEMIKLNKAGAGFAQLAYTGLGGIKRGLSEFNMARSESIFEAASTYKQLKDRLTSEFISTNGREPDQAELEKIMQTSENASHDNFWTNVGVLSVMNRIQFDNMFKQFSKSRSLLGPEMAQLEGKAFQVTGKIAGKTEARIYKKGIFGRIGALPEIAKTFGKKEAAWQATKSIGKGLMKFEGSEGMQELIQNASDKGLEDYYADLYHGKKGYATKLDAVTSSMQNPLTDTEGMKTFLMGALTGRIIAPFSFAFTKIKEGVTDKRSIKKATAAYKQLLEKQVSDYTERNGAAPEAEELAKMQEFAKNSTEYKSLKQHVDETIQSLNALYEDKTWFKNEALANIKINNKAAETMDEAAANHDKYIFNNVKDSALAKGVAAAIKLDLYDSLRDMLKEYGTEMSDEEFTQAFGMNPNKENKGNAKKLTENVVKQIEEYYNTFKVLKDKYSDRIIPELYKNNKPKDYANAREQKSVLDDVIEMLATNSYKAKQAIVRASGLQTEIGQNKAIGSSSIEVLTILGNDVALLEHTKRLKDQLNMMAASEVPLTAEQKEQYKDKQGELDDIINWYDSRDSLLSNTETEYSPAVETRAYKAFAALINRFNKRAHNYTNVSKEDIEDNFIKFIDYIKLNEDNRRYIDAMNLLSDPKNMKLVARAHMNALYAYAEKARAEQIREIEQATGVDVPKHSVIKDEDGTFSIKSHDGVIVESKLATEEEANAKAAEYDEKLKKALEEEEEKTKEKEEPEEEPVDIEAQIKELGVKLEKLPFDTITKLGKFLKSPGAFKEIEDVAHAVAYSYYKDDDAELIKAVDAELAALKVPTTTTKLTVDQLVDQFKNAKDKAELDKIMLTISQSDLDTFAFELTDEIGNTLEKAYDDRLKELEEIATKAGTAKTLTDTDPEFVKPYYEALDNIEKIVNKPGITVDEVKNAFRTLSPILAKLDSATKAEYNKKHIAEREAVIDRVKAEIASKDIEGAKKLITDSLASDDSINTSFQILYQQLNLKLSPEFKEEAIQHFEKEYIKAIDKKINKLISKVNASISNPALSFLISETENFKAEIEKTVSILKVRSQKLKEETDKLRSQNGGLNIETNPNFDNPVHRSILKRKNSTSTFGQRAAIENLIISGILTQADVDKKDENSKHGASELVNLGVARISTLEINKALAQYFRGEANQLKKLLSKYLSDSLEDITKEEIEEAVVSYFDKEEYPNADSILQAIGMPKVRELSKEEYSLISGYRMAIGNLISDTAVLDAIESFTNHQQNLVLAGGKVDNDKIISYSIVEDYLKRYLNENSDVSSLYDDLVETFEKLKNIQTSTDAVKLIKELNKKHFKIGTDGIAVLKALYSNALQTDNLLKSDSDGSKELTEEEIVKVLDDKNFNISLNKDQITQIEKYAKEEKLTEYKKKLQAAVGYSIEGPVYNAEKNIVVTGTSVAFNSLRQKFAKDQRTAEDLSKYLMPDENGMVQTKLALTFIAYSEYATDSEKALAKKLLEIVSDEDMMKIDNNIKSAGEFDPNTNQISINLNATGYDKNRPSAPIETVILHEIIHAMTEKSIADPASEYSKSIRNLYNTIKNTEGASTFYAFQDTLGPDEQLREFVAEAFTNPAFQYLLAKTPYTNTKQSMWDKFVETIGKILSALGIDISNTALSEVLSLTDQVLNKEAISKGDKFPTEKIMEEIKNANTKEDIDKIRENIDSNKDKFSPDIYNALDAALKGKMKSINARGISDSLKDMESIKVGKVTYYFTGDSKSFKVFKKGRSKINEVKDADILAKVKDLLDKRNPPPPPPPPPGGSSNTEEKVQVFSDLRDKDFVEDPSTLDFSTVDPGETITAVEPNGLRSKGNDGMLKDGEYIEYESFKKYYTKVRSIINKLSVASSSELASFYVTLDKDSAGFRWDGSAEDDGWKSAQKGVVGYISDKDGNPIVFNKEGKAIGKADRNDPASSRFNTGENQIVYFNTYTESTDKRSLDRIEKESLSKLFAARKRVMEGKPQIAKLQKVTPGQMVLKSMVKAQGASQKNTARDTELRDQLNQDHVTLKLVGKQLNAFITDADGGIQRTALFTPSTRTVKVTGPDGTTMSLFDHLIELMKVYHQMSADGNPNIGDIQKDLVKFAQNMWLTGDAYSLKIPQNFLGIWVKIKGKDGKSTMTRIPLFEMKNGILTLNENNLQAVKNHMNDMKVNISKMWLEGNEPFNFPYITEENGKKIINFEKKNYKDFLLNSVGLLTYISDIPEQENIRRYNSSVHFLEPSNLIPKPPTINVTQDNVVNNSDSTKKAVDNAVKNAKPTTGKIIKDPSKKKKLEAPSYEQTYKETYEKICK